MLEGRKKWLKGNKTQRQHLFAVPCIPGAGIFAGDETCGPTNHAMEPSESTAALPCQRVV